MRALICAAMATALAAAPAEARVMLRIDASQAEAVLDAYERRDAAAADAIAAMRPTQELIAHHAPFSDQINIENYRDSLRVALAGEPRRDLWGFQRLTTSAPAIRANIATITGDPDAFARALEAVIAPYTPSDLDLVVDVGLVMGTPGAGWTDRPNEFFFDIGVPAGDIEGAKVVCAHELYHLVLARILPDARLPESDMLGQLERVLLGAINEGMATHVARFSQGDTGALSRRSLEFEAANLRRMRDNFRLVDAMILAMAHTEAVSIDDVDRIAFGGAFTEPGYYVFREMAAGIEAAAGRERLMQFVTGRPSQFVIAYHELAAPDALRLHEETLALVRRLDARLARRR